MFSELYPVLNVRGDNPMKRFVLVCLSLFLFFPGKVFSIEILSNEKLASISGKAVTDNPAFNDPEVTFQLFSTDQSLRSFSHGNSTIYKTVAVDFYGKESTDASGNSYYEYFTVTPTVENIYYENEPYTNDDPAQFSRELYSQFVLEGILKAKIVIPEYFDNNPEIRSKDVTISQSRIDLPEGSSGKYLCSYQGNIYESGRIPEIDESFKIYPNRQTITVGSADGNDLMLLIPHGTGDKTVWKPVVKHYYPETSETEYLVIPQGKKFIHIGLNHMIQRMDMNFTLRLSHTKDKMKNMQEDISIPPDIGQTLGTFTMTGGETLINGGDVFITINDSLR